MELRATTERQVAFLPGMNLGIRRKTNDQLEAAAGDVVSGALQLSPEGHPVTVRIPSASTRHTT